MAERRFTSPFGRGISPDPGFLRRGGSPFSGRGSSSSSRGESPAPEGKGGAIHLTIQQLAGQCPCCFVFLLCLMNFCCIHKELYAAYNFMTVDSK